MNFVNWKKYLVLSAVVAAFVNYDVCLATEYSNSMFRVRNEDINNDTINMDFCNQTIDYAVGNINKYLQIKGTQNPISNIMQEKLFTDMSIGSKFNDQEILVTTKIVNFIKLLQFARTELNTITEDQVLGQIRNNDRRAVLLSALFKISQNCDVAQVVNALESSCSTTDDYDEFNVFEQFIQLAVNNCNLANKLDIKHLIDGLMSVFNNNIKDKFKFQLTYNNAVISYYNNYCFKSALLGQDANALFNMNEPSNQKILQDVSNFLQQLEKIGYSRFPMKSEDYLNLAIYIELVQKLYPDRDIIKGFVQSCSEDKNKNMITSAADLMVKMREYLKTSTYNKLGSGQNNTDQWSDLEFLSKPLKALGYEIEDLMVLDHPADNVNKIYEGGVLMRKPGNKYVGNGRHLLDEQFVTNMFRECIEAKQDTVCAGIGIIRPVSASESIKRIKDKFGYDVFRSDVDQMNYLIIKIKKIKKTES